MGIKCIKMIRTFYIMTELSFPLKIFKEKYRFDKEVYVYMYVNH